MAQATMAQGGFLEPKRMSPTSLAIVIALHGAALTALALAKDNFTPPAKMPPIIVDMIKNPIEPEPLPKEPDVIPTPQPQHPSLVDKIPPIVPTAQDQEVLFQTGQTDPFPPPTPAGPLNIEPQPQPAVMQSARATGDVRALFRPDDYPSVAQQRQETGAVRARLDIAVNGKVAGCSIVDSSGSRALDTAACRILKNRARFTPAKDSNGQPTTDSYVTPPIVWKLIDA